MLPYNPDSHTLRAGQILTLRWPDRSLQARLRAIRGHKRFRLMHLDGFDSATAAEALVGAEVAIDANELPAAGPNEFYHRDLIGLHVWTSDGRELGTVAEVLSTGSNDVCVVRGNSGESLIPLIADVVHEVDLAGGRLVVVPLPGLLDT
jgi:16S rRNA processing protein RimM